MKLAPTPMQKRLLDHLIKHHAENGVYPSTREICKTLGYSSPSTVHAMMHRLERRGLVRIKPYLNRGIEIVVD
jgi:repressor LexA